MKIILDTSFILTCIKEKVDFLKASEFGGLFLPKEVLKELENLIKKGKGSDKRAASLALEVIEKNWNNLDIIELKEDYVDKGIENYIDNTNQEIAVATIDRELKKRINGKARRIELRAKKRMTLV